MNIHDWVSEIQAHPIFVAGACIFLLAVIFLTLKSVRRYPTKTMVALMAVVMMLAGGVTIYNFFVLTGVVRAAHSWPTVQGVITDSKVETYDETVIDPQTQKTSTSRTTSTVITYQYTVAVPRTRKLREEESRKHTYTSSTLRLSNRPNYPGLVKEYPVGKRVVVHYEPNNPSHAFLELESTASLLGPFVGIVLELLAFAFIYYVVKAK